MWARDKLTKDYARDSSLGWIRKSLRCEVFRLVGWGVPIERLVWLGQCGGWESVKSWEVAAKAPEGLVSGCGQEGACSRDRRLAEPSAEIGGCMKREIWWNKGEERVRVPVIALHGVDGKKYGCRQWKVYVVL